MSAASVPPPTVCWVLEKLVLRGGVEIVRQRSGLSRVPHAGDIYADHLEPLAQELDEAREAGTSMSVHGLEGGQLGHFVVPVASIVLVEVIVTNLKGERLTVTPGWAGDADEMPPVEAQRPVVRNLRSVSPTQP